MWIDRKIRPQYDKVYMVQTIFGYITPMHYTVKGGWNTRYANGQLFTDQVIEDELIVRWFDMPEPPAITTEEVTEFYERRKDATTNSK